MTPDRGWTVLVVEEEPIQALDLADTLHGLGYAVLGPASSGPEALGLLHRQQPDFALLDAQLLHGGAWPVAKALAGSGVPFAVLATGHEGGPLDHRLLREAPRLEKPYRGSELRRSVHRLQLTSLGMRLAQVEQRIAEGRARLTQQLRLVERLERGGYDTGLAQAILREIGRGVRLLRQRRALLLREVRAAAEPRVAGLVRAEGSGLPRREAQGHRSQPAGRLPVHGERPSSGTAEPMTRRDDPHKGTPAETPRAAIVPLLPELRGFARSLSGGDVHLADDLVQDTVMLALRGWGQFQPGTNLKSWLFRILHNRFHSLKRRKHLAAEVVRTTWRCCPGCRPARRA
jgi:CheY-like chemotaxis protein